MPYFLAAFLKQLLASSYSPLATARLACTYVDGSSGLRLPTLVCHNGLRFLTKNKEAQKNVFAVRVNLSIQAKNQA